MTTEDDHEAEAKAGDEEDQRTEATIEAIEVDDATAPHAWVLQDLMAPRDVARLGPRVDAGAMSGFFMAIGMAQPFLRRQLSRAREDRSTQLPSW